MCGREGGEALACCAITVGAAARYANLCRSQVNLHKATPPHCGFLAQEVAPARCNLVGAFIVRVAMRISPNSELQPVFARPPRKVRARSLPYSSLHSLQLNTPPNLIASRDSLYLLVLPPSQLPARACLRFLLAGLHPDPLSHPPCFRPALHLFPPQRLLFTACCLHFSPSTLQQPLTLIAHNCERIPVKFAQQAHRRVQHICRRSQLAVAPYRWLVRRLRGHLLQLLR